MERKINPITGWVALCVSSVFFLGFLPGKITGRPGKGGGFMGSLAAAIPMAIMFYCAVPVWIPALVAVFIFFLGWLATGIGEQFMKERWGAGQRHTGEWVVHDRNETCVDEVCGMLIAGLPAWLLYNNPTCGLLILTLSFIIFRIWDAKKLWPVGFVEDLFRYSSFGVMFDDVIGGIVTLLLVIFCLPFLSSL